MYLWLKAIHVIFMVTWFAGLFYLPRLFIYHAMDENNASFDLFKVMEKRLFGIMTIGAAVTVFFGVGLLSMNWGYLVTSGWFMLKLVFIAALFGYHYWCYRIMLEFREGRNQRSHVWYRWFNEAPAVALIVIVIMVVVKPF
ncbi:protoporphyrinogen oxidase HemJ [Leucothrix mucor]|uniref:protoporphyrinogen oxidase HemJ n=1 Tax=Leucothrix mucor TaxID=45248 RepID=UPI0003B71E06|nr:protoporphyrinogen oxidase HemJ [Leucothrix mucor]